MFFVSFCLKVHEQHNLQRFLEQLFSRALGPEWAHLEMQEGLVRLQIISSLINLFKLEINSQSFSCSSHYFFMLTLFYYINIRDRFVFGAKARVFLLCTSSYHVLCVICLFNRFQKHRYPNAPWTILDDDTKQHSCSVGQTCYYGNFEQRPFLFLTFKRNKLIYHLYFWCWWPNYILRWSINASVQTWWIWLWSPRPRDQTKSHTETEVHHPHPKLMWKNMYSCLFHQIVFCILVWNRFG